MNENNINQSFVDNLLNSVFHDQTLRGKYQRRLNQLEINETRALQMLKIEHRALNGILDGTQKRIDSTVIQRLAEFLELPISDVFSLYLDAMNANLAKPNRSQSLKDFLKSNFDLPALKKEGLIADIKDADEIEKKLTSLLGLKHLFQYKRPSGDVAFSTGLRQAKDDRNRDLWLEVSRTILQTIGNPHHFDRKKLIEYFPKIRWHSQDCRIGLLEVIKDLYRLGITVIYQSRLGTMNIKGATIEVHSKPCIVLTDYRGFYTTLWLTLIHELYHVLFDWDEIRHNEYHISEHDNAEMQLPVKEREQKAENFAREYLLPKAKLDLIKPYYSDDAKIQEYAKNNHLHFSMVYALIAYDIKTNKLAWKLAQDTNPSLRSFKEQLDMSWGSAESSYSHAMKLKQTIYK